jgi:hypothetical protein
MISLIKLILSSIKSSNLSILPFSTTIGSQTYYPFWLNSQDFQFVLSWPKTQICFHSFHFCEFILSKIGLWQKVLCYTPLSVPIYENHYEFNLPFTMLQLELI